MDQIPLQVIRKSLHYVSDEVYEDSSYDFKESEARYKISTLPGWSSPGRHYWTLRLFTNAPWPGCIIELGVKYSGNNLISKTGISQDACATLCLTETKCTHWTYNPTRVKCWLKTSSQVNLLNRTTFSVAPSTTPPLKFIQHQAPFLKLADLH